MKVLFCGLFFLSASLSFVPSAFSIDAAQLRSQMLLSPPAEEAGYSVPLSGDHHLYALHHVIHRHKSWSAQLDLSEVDHVEILTDPLPLGQFHSEIGLFLKHPLVLTNPSVTPTSISILTIGTGPRLPSKWEAITSRQSNSTIMRSIDENLIDAPKSLNERRILPPQRINQNLLILAFLEESTRLYFFEIYRLLSIRTQNGLRSTDSVQLDRYTLFNENCISSTVRNLSLALDPADREWALRNPALKHGIHSFASAPTETELFSRLLFFSAALEQILPEFLRLKNTNETQWDFFSAEILKRHQTLFQTALQIELDWQNHFGEKDLTISLPFHAKVLFDHIAPIKTR
jgi:hypothetical protein